VTHINPSIQSLLDVFAKELQAQLAQGHPGTTSVTPSTSAEPALSDFIWWSSGLSFDPSSRILLGASPETWEKLFAADELAARITELVEHTARSRFGSEVTCVEAERTEAPPAKWTSLPLTVTREPEASVVIHFSVSPDLETALGASANDESGKNGEPLANAAVNLAEILMDVTMPVSVSLGRTKMYMKDLLHLTNGSIVELDQDLGEEVEIRVNNCVLAYGEVVAVDGNYAVRILRMAPGRNTPDLRGAPRERAA
jgi:flagellar motor switch protein FliN/FliY